MSQAPPPPHSFPRPTAGPAGAHGDAPAGASSLVSAPAPSVGASRTALAVRWSVAFLLLPLVVIGARMAMGNVGWLWLAYLLFGGWLHAVLGVAAASALWFLPRVNAPEEPRAGVRAGTALHALYAVSWLTGVIGMAVQPDYGDAPESGAVAAPLEALFGFDAAAQIGSTGGLVLLGVSLLAGLAAVVVVAVRAVRAARATRARTGHTNRTRT